MSDRRRDTRPVDWSKLEELPGATEIEIVQLQPATPTKEKRKTNWIAIILVLVALAGLAWAVLTHRLS